MLSFLRKPKPVCGAVVVAGRGDVRTDLTGETLLEPLSALTLCYAAKLRWLMLSEEPLVAEVFENVYRKTLESWPEVPYVEMVASLGPRESKYKIDVRHDPKGVGWFATDSLPLVMRSRNDLATHFYFMLREVAAALSDRDLQVLGHKFESYGTHLFGAESIAEGMSGLSQLNRGANAVLNEEDLL